MKTLVHKNLHNGLWAITQRGQVVGYCKACTLIDWDSKEDRKKAAFSRSGGKRTVHLWARGTLVYVDGFQPLKGREVAIADIPGYSCDRLPARVRYNPAHHDCFMVDGRPMTSGQKMLFASNVWAL